MNLTKLSINDQLGLAGMILTNTTEETPLMDALASRNYDQTKIDVGTAHYDAAVGKVDSLTVAERELKTLTG